MFKIQSASRINKEFLVEHIDAKDQIIGSMLVDFAHEMFKRKCFKIEETNIKGEINYMPDELHTVIEAYIIKPDELKRAIEIINILKLVLQDPFKTYVYELYDILTKEN